MRRRGYLALAVALVMTLTSPLYAAAPKAGAKCTKKSATTTSGGKLFTCIQSGKKLVWNKGVAIKKPIPVASPTPTPSPTPAITLIPTATPTPTPAPSASLSLPDEPRNILNLENEYDGVAYWAWKKSSEKIMSSSSSVNHFEIHVGPNSGILNTMAKEATELTSRLYAGVRQPAKNYFVSFAFEDSQWAEKKIEEFLNDPVLLSQLRKSQSGPQDLRTYWACPNVERCHSSTAMNNKDGTAIILAGYTPSRLGVVTETKGWLQSHEHTHIIQQEQFMGTSRENGGTINSFIYMQGWMIEGGANFGGYASTHFRSFDDYRKGRQTDVDRMPRVDAAWFEKFINMSNQERDQFTQGEIYHVGFMINEIFAALKGPNAQMELYKKVAAGDTFEKAFEEIFGAPWKSAVPVISRVLASERIRK
jgi:hypothetical protein